MRLLLVGGGHAHVEVLRRFAGWRPDGIALTLVSPSPQAAYSGMLPGVIAGHYRLHDIHVALRPLCERAGAAFVADRVVALDLEHREALLAASPPLPFDVAALDVGSTPAITAEGAAEHAIAVKPIDRFVAAWNETLGAVRSRSIRSIAVVGGLGGAEVALAMRHRLRELRQDVAMHVITARWNVAPALARRLEGALARNGIACHGGRSVLRVEAEAVVLDDGTRIEANRAFWAAGAAAPAWLRESGIACDGRGFMRVDECLRSPSHPFAFGAGDCATQDGRATPKSGVYAVRQGPVLAENLRRVSAGAPLSRYVPQSRALALVATGDRSAIASYGDWTAEGRLAWRWKDAIDRRFVARYRVPQPT
jgi:selenide,water dikinase